MATPTTSVVEIVAGLAAAHADVIVVVAAEAKALLAAHGHPFVNVIRCGVSGKSADADVALGDTDDALDAYLADVFAGAAAPISSAFVNFQVARGPTGVSA